MSTTAPSFFHDVTNVLLTPSTGSAIPVFACTGIKLDRSNKRIYGWDNNVTRPVASHVVEQNDKVSLQTEDVAAIVAAYGLTTTFVLTFNWLPDAQHTGSPTLLGEQLVTISNFVIDDQSADAKMRARSSGSIAGMLLGVEAGTDPVVFAAGS
jgi:hypothetical protein